MLRDQYHCLYAWYFLNTGFLVNGQGWAGEAGRYMEGISLVPNPAQNRSGRGGGALAPPGLGGLVLESSLDL